MTTSMIILCILVAIGVIATAIVSFQNLTYRRKDSIKEFNHKRNERRDQKTKN